MGRMSDIQKEEEQKGNLSPARASLKFNPGKLVMTRGVNDHIAEDLPFAKFVLDCLKRHVHGDWGDMCKEDRAENEFALGRPLRLFSAYEGPRKIWIITEADRSVTTILFPDEY